MIGDGAPTSPYKGLAAFDDSDLDALLFFGRGRETETIAVNLQASRLTVLYGAAGVGKSSVLRAGVAHRLRQEPDVDVRIVDSWVGDVIAALRDTLADASKDADLYVILDQFEEYFVYQSDHALADELAEIVGRGGMRVNVLISIRDDSLALLDRFKRRLPNLLANRLQLDRLDREAARMAILGPVERYNRLVGGSVEVEPGLVDEVLDQVSAGRLEIRRSGRGVAAPSGEERVEAPLLQLVLERLWETERADGSSRLRLETLERLGGAAQIVHAHLERAMGALTDTEKSAAAAMYNQLVTPSGTKIAHRVADLAGYASIGEPEAATVLRKLTQERILRASSDHGSTATRYEIFHDVLADAVLDWRSRHEEAVAVRRAHEQRRRARLIAAAALVALGVVSAIAVFALVQRSDARTQTRHAHARQLAAQAQLQLPTDPLTSLSLAIRAAGLDRTPEIERALRDAALTAFVRNVYRTPRSVAAGSERAVAVGDARGRILIFPRQRGSQRTFRVGAPVTAIAISRDGRVLAIGTPRAVLIMRGASRVGRIAVPRSPTALAVGMGGRRVAVGFGDGSMRLLRPGRRSVHVRGSVRSLAYSPNEKLLLLTSHDRRARLYDAETGRPLQVFEHRGFVDAAEFSPDGALIATASEDKYARLWDSETGQLRKVLPSAVGHVDDIAFSPDGMRVAAASADGITRIYDVASGIRLLLLIGHPNAVVTVDFSPDGRFVVTGSADRTARVWEAETGRPRRTLSGHDETVTAAFFTNGGRHVLTTSLDGTARVWESGTLSDLRVVIRGKTPITSLAVSPDGGRLLYGDRAGHERVWSFRRHRIVLSRSKRGRVASVVFTPSPRAVTAPYVGSFAREAGLWAVAGPRTVEVMRLPGHRRVFRRLVPGAQALAFTPAGDLLAVGSADGTVRIFDVKSNKLVGRFAGHPVELTSLEFSPDGRRLLTTGRDADVRLFSVPSGRLLATLPGHGGLVSDASFSPDGRWIAAAFPTTIGIWAMDDLSTPRLLRGHGPVIRAVVFAPNGYRIFSAGDDGTVRSYDCVVCRPLDQLVPVAERRVAATKPR